MNKSIVEFAKYSLGCKCSDEVFKQIDEFDKEKDENGYWIKKIIVGRRLLILLIDSEGCKYDKGLIEYYIKKGVEERNRDQLNRLRIVLIIGDMNNYSESNTELENLLPDDKVHLHFVLKEEVSEIF